MYASQKVHDSFGDGGCGHHVVVSKHGGWALVTVRCTLYSVGVSFMLKQNPVLYSTSKIS